MNNAVIIVVDRLSAAYLGPYGNTWIETPALNRLASQGTLLENTISDSPSLEAACQAYWRGAHALYGGGSQSNHCLPRQLAAAGIETVLVTDSAPVGDHPLARHFDQRLLLEPALPERPADNLEQTQLGLLFAAAIERLEEVRQPVLLWVHAQALGAVWDAPQALREQFADEDDPPPSTAVQPPDTVLEQDFDPDQLLSIVHAYAGQVAALDTCVAPLLRAIDAQLPTDRTLVVLTSPRGFALGEHGRIGACGDRLFGEVMQVPCIVRHPDETTRAQRCHTLVQPPDLYATLLDWFGQVPQRPEPWSRSLLPLLADERAWTRQLVCAAGAGQRAIRTPIWLLVDQADQPPLLFAKPDDRWEANEVADRCEEIASQLQETLSEIHHSSKDSHLSQIPQISDDLVREM